MYLNILIPLTASLFLVSCASNQNNSVSSDQNLQIASSSAFSAIVSTPSLHGEVTRSRAIKHAVTYSPKLRALRAELRALHAEVLQAGLRPNPELGLEIENFSGSGNTHGFKTAEITAAVSQKLELGGKRAKRHLVANLKAQALTSAIRSMEQEVTIETDKAFTALLAARKLRLLAEENLASSQEQVKTLDSLIEAGATSSIDGNKARLARSESRELLAEARSSETSAAAMLSQIWGGGSANIKATGSLDSNGLTTTAVNPGIVISKHPSMKSAALVFALNQAIYKLQKAYRISDVSISGGVRNFGESNDTAAVVGISIPLPLYNKNQGNIRAAEERVDKARAQGQAVESRLRLQVTQLNADLRSAKSRVVEIDSRTVAAARKALSDTQTAYAAGKKSLLEYIDARKTLFEIERRQIKARADLQKASNSLKHFSRN
ncbi:MAG: TolC family protein [Verrucomicrobiae bacterium]|nr:TolC family protein [Verrucomicrobiae bacterium]NNJ42676.1 TolC family protein [Akkermansiaceae bacterium]